MTKAELRQLYLEKRRALPMAEIAEASRKIAERFFAEIDLDKVKSLSTFIRIAKFSEIDTSNIYYRLWRDQAWIRTFAPRADIETGEIESVALFPDTQFSENRWGVREPLDGETVEPSDLDMVLVPLLCVDANGHRVGYGKGFYDRFLKECRSDCIKVGLNYFPPFKQIFDIGEHDIPLNVCITPEKTYWF